MTYLLIYLIILILFLYLWAHRPRGWEGMNRDRYVDLIHMTEHFNRPGRLK